MFPKMCTIRQDVPAPEIENPRLETMKELERIGISGMNLAGLTVGITVGSRGIYKISKIVKAVIEAIAHAGGLPVIIPAMGSHGGGTAEGQREVLVSLGITEETMGAPIRACAQTVQIGVTALGIPVFINQEALKVDRLVLLNKVKQHTDFSGSLESGLHKMLTIGLGGPKGADIAHYYAMLYGYEEVITQVAEVGLAKLPLLFALGILENWRGHTLEIRAMLPDEMKDQEKAMLARAKAGEVKLPFDNLDVLVIGEIGKNISGSGMDTKVVGRIRILGQKEPEHPQIKRIAVLNLTPESHGNATGIGLADFAPQRVFEAINLQATALNCITSMAPEHARIPCILKSDQEVIKAALRTSCPESSAQARMVYIQNTLKLESMAVSEAMLEDVQRNSRLKITSSLEDLRFDADGNLNYGTMSNA